MMIRNSHLQKKKKKKQSEILFIETSMLQLNHNKQLFFGFFIEYLQS